MWGDQERNRPLLCACLSLSPLPSHTTTHNTSALLSFPTRVSSSSMEPPMLSDPEWDGGDPPSCGEEEVDYTDGLPDAVLLVILNKVADVKDLGRCRAVCRRFRSLVGHVDHVLVRVDCVVADPDGNSSSSSPDHPPPSDKARGVLYHLVRLIVRPFQVLGQILAVAGSGGPSSSPHHHHGPCPHVDASHHSPAEVLQGFREIRCLRIELPAGELGVEDGALIRWNADFGSTLHGCVILGASEVGEQPESSSSESCEGGGEEGSIPESFYTNGGLKMRVVWTISSLIAASARHYLLQPIIAGHETLEGLELSDADGQGVLRMSREQLAESRARPACTSGSSQRTLVPALDMRLWYAPQLEVEGGEGGGMVLKGATLIAIRPSREEEGRWDGGGGGFDATWISGAFEEPYAEVARLLMKRRTYCLEMNSF